MSSPRWKEFENVVRSAEERLRALSEAESGKRPGPGKWSPKEVLGHLIDSAANNHQRFVRALFTDDLVFPGYAQDDWVRVQRYREAPWDELIGLWTAYNLHLLRVVSAIPDDTLTRRRTRHNLHQIAWRTVPESEPATLEYFIEDYVGHLLHHLGQIFR